MRSTKDIRNIVENVRNFSKQSVYEDESKQQKMPLQAPNYNDEMR